MNNMISTLTKYGKGLMSVVVSKAASCLYLSLVMFSSSFFLQKCNIPLKHSQNAKNQSPNILLKEVIHKNFLPKLVHIYELQVSKLTKVPRVLQNCICFRGNTNRISSLT